MVDITEAVAVLQAGGLIAYPTETFYGLGALPSRPEAIERLWQLKDREAGGPLLLLVPDFDVAAGLVRPGVLEHAAVQALARRFWPGALTMVVDAREGLDRRFVGPDGGVAIRVSSHPVAARLVGALGEPLTATSANRRGEPPARTPADIVAAGLDSDLDLVVQGGETQGEHPSTVVRLFAGRATVIRQGAIPADRLAAELARVSFAIE